MSYIGHILFISSAVIVAHTLSIMVMFVLVTDDCLQHRINSKKITNKTVAGLLQSNVAANILLHPNQRVFLADVLRSLD